MQASSQSIQRSGLAANRSCAQSYCVLCLFVFFFSSGRQLQADDDGWSCRRNKNTSLLYGTHHPVLAVCFRVRECYTLTHPLTLVMFSSTGSEMPWAWRPHNLPTRCSTARFIGTVITCSVRGKCQARVLELRQTGKVLAGAIVADWFPGRLLSSATAAVPTPDRPITPTPVHVARTRKSPNRHLVAPRQTFETASTIF